MGARTNEDAQGDALKVEIETERYRVRNTQLEQP